jgi:hypothetical protein
MTGILLAFPVLAAVTILQSAILSRTPLLGGTADLMLLALAGWVLHDRVRTPWLWALLGGAMMGYLSALPMVVYPGSYLAVTGLALLIRRRVWKAPILAMFATVFAGTLIVHVASLLAVSLRGTLLPLAQVVNLITLPSLLLNLLLAAPVFVVMRDLANWVYPEEFEI